MHCFAVIVLLTGMLLPTFSANANSAPIKTYDGTLHTGALAIDPDCPLTVSTEVLTFNIQNFPDDHPEGEYSADFSAEYLFFNPTDTDYTATLAFPFGTTDVLFAEGEQINRDKLWVSVNGINVNAKIRYTYFPNNDAEFFTRDELSKIRDGYAEDVFFSPDMPVSKITYHLKRSPGCKFANLDLSGCYDPSFRIMGSTGTHFGYSDIQEIVIYIIGTLPTDLPEWNFYEDSNMTEKSEGEVTVISTEQMTFGDLALSMRDAESPISKVDWYNAVVDALNGPGGHPEYTGEHTYYEGLLNVSHSLLGWLVYDMTVPARAYVTNTVSAPIYPYYDHRLEPTVYSYKYLLSPAKEWKEFGSLTVIINTPFYMTGCSVEGFEKTDDGYILELENLPDGELSFDLCTSENPSEKFDILTVFLIVILVLFSLLYTLSPVIIAIIITVSVISIIIAILTTLLFGVLTVAALLVLLITLIITRKKRAKGR